MIYLENLIVDSVDELRIVSSKQSEYGSTALEYNQDLII